MNEYYLGLNIPLAIIAEADERCRKRHKEAFKAYLNKQHARVSNVILDQLPSINGLPVSAYLNRMIGWNPYIKHANTTIEQVLEEQLTKLDDIESANQNENEISSKADEKVHAARVIAQIAANPSEREALGNWLQTNVGTLNERIANSMTIERRDLTEELCYCVTYLARQYHFQMLEKLDNVIASMVRVLATILIPWENYVEQYREAKERHNDFELARGRPMLFHFPLMEYQFSEVNYSLLAVIYYSMGDLLFNVPSPKLIHFFECRIFRRKEMTRNILFTIMLVIATNLSELQAEAEKLQRQGHTKSVDLTATQSVGPLTSRRGRGFNEAIWNDLPGSLYADIIRVYNDRNRANKLMINEIMALLRAHAPEKLPIFEEATLKALELYSGAAMGRGGETYQIGRNAGSGGVGGVAKSAEGNVITGPRKYRAGVPEELGQTQTGLPRELGVTSSGTTGPKGLIEKSAENLDSSPSRPKQGATLSAEMVGSLVERLSDIVSSESEQTDEDEEEDDETESVGSSKDLNIMRKTWIVPKIPDLVQTTRARKRNRQPS